VSLRPSAARWFELLAAREDAAPALELLARTGAVELEIKGEEERLIGLRDMRELVAQFGRLERRYHAYWPRQELRAGLFHGGPYRILRAALEALLHWEKQAAPLIARLESLTATQRNLNLFADMLRLAQPSVTLDCALLAAAGPILVARLFVLPAHSRIDAATDRLLLNHYTGRRQDFVLAVGTPETMSALAQSLTASKGRVVPIPDFVAGDCERALEQIERRLAYLDTEAEGLRQKISILAEVNRVHMALGEIRRLDWFLNHVDRLPVSPHFAWITGWTSDPDGRQLDEALATGDVRALVHYPAPPPGLQPPMVLRNPVWGRPFEPFVRMLGMPAAGEADPSSLLAILVPLMFGYMFGDVGQGLVLMAAGLLLRRRWPLLDILVVNGFAATLFGAVFGSVFGREDIIPALWLQPMVQPLPVLQVPLAGGVLVLLLGLTLKALQYLWQGEARQWWRIEAPQLLLYVSLLMTPFWPSAGLLAVSALIWYLLGALLQQRHDPAYALPAALGALVENLLQLLVNTLSFVRVGAFALAHAGLAQAFMTLADIPDSRLMALVILFLGNLVIIVLEGLVVTIQTTRLVLFEFFIRFVRAGGRVFRPLAAPASGMGLGGEA